MKFLDILRIIRNYWFRRSSNNRSHAMLVDLVSASQKEDWSEFQRVLFKHWLVTCPKLFGINSDQPWDNSECNEKAISEQLFIPLVSAFCGDSQNKESTLSVLNHLIGIDPAKSCGQICGHVFKNGELTYTCMDCATDGTCVMCLKCFEASIHKNHKYRMHQSSGSGYCDCGDADAWRDGHACALHSKKNEVEIQLPEDLERRLRVIVDIILHYCISLITHKDDLHLPTSLELVKEEMNKESNISTATQYLTVLYNDETHTYESVIKVLELYIHCTKDQAMLVATIVDREGRSAVKLGSKTDCSKAKEDVQRKTSRDPHASIRRGGDRNLPLAVKVMDIVLFAHQNHAIQLLTWLNAQMDVFAPLREIVGEAMLNCKMNINKDYSVNNDADVEMHSDKEHESCEKMEVDDETKPVNSYLETILLQNTDMWKAARSIIHQMLMRTVFMNYDQKMQFAKAFMKHYDQIYKDFIEDDHDMDVSVVGLTVQFLTVPSLARRLIAEDDAFTTITNAIIIQTNKYVKTDDGLKRFDFTGRSFPNDLRRSLQICRDLSYLLNAVPTENDWTLDLKRYFIQGYCLFLDFLHHLQGMDEVKRQSVEHQVWESEWETAFNILLRIKDAISLIVLWAQSDREVHNCLLMKALEALDKHPITTLDPELGHFIKVEVNGVSISMKNFDVLRGGVSIHLPIVRLTAALFSAHDFVDFFYRPPKNELEGNIQNVVLTKGGDLYELSLRVLVLCAQMNAQLWRRNGFSLINQVHNYFSALCRNEMFDRDVLMMQVGAAITDPEEYLLHLMHRYRLVNWADPAFEGVVNKSPNAKMDTEDLSRIAVTMAEEFFYLLILIVGERYAAGVGNCDPIDGLKRQVIHILCTGSQTYSHIQQKMSHEVNGERLSLHDAVNQVADFRKPLATSAGQFYLKEEFWPMFTPFFIHYSKSDQSAAEQYQHKVRKNKEKRLQACPPPIPPAFTRFYKNIPQLLRTPMLIKVMRLVIDRTAKRNRFSSDRLFQKVLYVIGMALNEEELDPKNYDFTGIAEETCDLLSSMESIQGKPESSICHLLLDYTVEKYKTLRTLRCGTSHVSSTQPQDTRCAETAEEAKAKRSARAAEMRKKALAKMSNMQSKFMKQIEDEEEKNRKDEVSTSNADEKREAVELDGRSDYDEDIVRQIGSDFPVCIGANKWTTEMLNERKLTCILCQEDEPVHPINRKPMVCAAFIQKSQLFTHKNRHGELLTASAASLSTRDLLAAPATLQHGVDVSTCSHSMHFECYKLLSESNKSRDSLRARQQNQHNQKMVDSDGGEYQCPLCKRLSNAAIPILPASQLTQQIGFSKISGAQNEEFEDWVARIKKSLDLPCAAEGVRKKGHSRKRSHSERSLLDLEKQANEKGKEEDLASTCAGLLSFSSASSTTISDSGVHVESPANSPSQAAQSGMAVVSEIINTIREENQIEPENAEFYNELAAMILDNGSTAASPTNTPERTPAGGVTTSPRSNESTPVGDGTRKPLSQIQHVLSTLIRPLPALINPNRFCGNGLEQYEDSIKELGKNMIKCRRRGNEMKVKFIEKHLRGYAIATVTWQSSAHVARAISAYLDHDGKPLFGALNTRQRDCLSGMARLCATLSHNSQFLLHAVADMLRILCCEPPKTKLSQIPNSPTTSNSSNSSQTGSNFAFLVQLFNPAGPRKNANFNILHVDILSLAIALMMSIGWTWHNGVQSMQPSGSQKARQLIPDGSVDEAHVLRLALIAHYFQIIATYEEPEDENIHEEPEELSSCDKSTLQLISKLFSLSRPGTPVPKDLVKLYERIKEGAKILLSPIALLYHFLTLVDPPEALKDPSINSCEALFRYLSLPSKIEDQISGSLVENLFSMWSNAIPRDVEDRKELVVQPVRPNLLVNLPHKYSELINQVSTFRCPSIPIEEPTSNVPTICLVCGMVLCSQAYCCQKIIDKQPYGACRYHMSQCSGSVGIFLRVRDCNLVLMTTRKRGCFRPAPYVDEFGEVDQGFRRGNPLHLNIEMYHKLKQLWLQQGITEEVVNYNEIDFRNVQYDWAHF